MTTLIAAGTLAAVSALPAAALDISGAGATFPYPIYAKWADAYKKETGVGMNYQSIGSGGGIKQIFKTRPLRSALATCRSSPRT